MKIIKKWAKLKKIRIYLKKIFYQNSFRTKNREAKLRVINIFLHNLTRSFASRFELPKIFFEKNFFWKFCFSLVSQFLVIFSYQVNPLFSPQNKRNLQDSNLQIFLYLFWCIQSYIFFLPKLVFIKQAQKKQQSARSSTL